MKRLYLARHTKSSWEMPGVDDMHRPLLEKGIQKSKKAIRFLNEIHAKADKIISSPAVRALETARLIAAGIGYPKEKILIDPSIYEGSINRIVELIYATEDETDSLMMFGHNPTITHLANLFLNPGIEFMPTMGIVCVSFNTDKWSAIPLAETKNEFIMFPKLLPD
jgi:phosphohistidine phosphatase